VAAVVLARVARFAAAAETADPAEASPIAIRSAGRNRDLQVSLNGIPRIKSAHQEFAA